MRNTVWMQTGSRKESDIMSGKRLDVLLTEKGLFASREKAKASIMAGMISVDGRLADKPGMSTKEDAEISVKADSCPYVGRGGLKLEKALRVFDIDLDGTVCVDMGASTGGFTDCMLQNGAAHVYAVDVGYGQLAWKLRTDERVTNIERTNIRYMDTSLIKEPADVITIDVSFISLELILPVAEKILSDSGSIIALVKPQFEAGREQVGKNGIVRDRAVHAAVIGKVAGAAKPLGLGSAGVDHSPVTGAKGNIEYLLHLKRGDSTLTDADIEKAVEASHRELE